MLSVEQINKLQEENAVLQAYKDVNEDFKTAWEELKAENERLKALFCKEQDLIKLIERTQDDYEKCILQKEHFEKRAKKAENCLQEIKGVVTALYMNNWLQMNETARKSIQLLQELITKAEEE